MNIRKTICLIAYGIIVPFLSSYIGGTMVDDRYYRDIRERCSKTAKKLEVLIEAHNKNVEIINRNSIIADSYAREILKYRKAIQKSYDSPIYEMLPCENLSDVVCTNVSESLYCSITNGVVNYFGGAK